MTLAKCPNCHNIIDREDVEDINFRGNLTAHYAYVCRKCQRARVRFEDRTHYCDQSSI